MVLGIAYNPHWSHFGPSGHSPSPEAILLGHPEFWIRKPQGQALVLSPGKCQKSNSRVPPLKFGGPVIRQRTASIISRICPESLLIKSSRQQYVPYVYDYNESAQRPPGHSHPVTFIHRAAWRHLDTPRLV